MSLMDIDDAVKRIASSTAALAVLKVDKKGRVNVVFADTAHTQWQVRVDAGYIGTYDKRCDPDCLKNDIRRAQ